MGNDEEGRGARKRQAETETESLAHRQAKSGVERQVHTHHTHVCSRGDPGVMCRSPPPSRHRNNVQLKGIRAKLLGDGNVLYLGVGW